MKETFDPYEEDAQDLSGPAWPEDEYPEYNSNDTRVISGPLGGAKFKGTRFSSWQEAEDYCQDKYHLVRFGVVPGRWMARIKK